MLKPYKKNLCSKYATKMISIKVNNECNMNCSFCVDRGGYNSNVININKIAENAIAQRAYKTVIITGGEPFLIFDKVIILLKKLRPYKKRLVLNTNGSMLTADKCKALNGLIDELQVSIHHNEEAINNSVFNGAISFENIKQSLAEKEFQLSINSTFNNYCPKNLREQFVSNMVNLCRDIGANNLRLTELKKVPLSEFVSAKEYFQTNHNAIVKNSNELITNGCTWYYKTDGLTVSVKRLCEYAKGENAESFSCCFIDERGQKKIDVETEPTFKVIYSNGEIKNDWVFSQSSPSVAKSQN